MIEIISAGMLSTIQDLGRFSVMKDGFTQSGVMDAYSTSEISKIPPEIAKICSSVNLAVIPSIVISITGALTSFLQKQVANGTYTPLVSEVEL